MKASQAALDVCVVYDLAVLAKVRTTAARSVLTGGEVWLKTYRAVADACAGLGITDVPPPAARASRRKPCAECANMSAEVHRLYEEIAGYQQDLGDANQECARLRARVAELEAPQSLHVPQSPTTGVAKVFGALPDMPLPAPRLSSVPPPKPRERCHVTLDTSQVPPEALVETG